MKKYPLLEILRRKYFEIKSEKLYSHILCGDVLVGGEKIRDPKALFPMDVELYISEKKYVSRGGLKLEKALDVWKIDVKGKIVLDAGSSTGGFTDCLIKHGASLVHAVDCGFNQLDFSLRNNPKVISHEKTNIMELSALKPEPDFAVADLSFRSIVQAAGKILALTKNRGLIALIKPQFEERGFTENFDGVVHNSDDILLILKETVRLLWNEKSYISAIIESPIHGTKGNREFLCAISEKEVISLEDILKNCENIVNCSN